MRPTRWAYFDVSVLVKRYVKEQGSVTARRLLQQYRFLSSAVAPVEVLSLVNRQRTLGELTQRDCLTFLAASGLIVPFITADVLQRKVAETMALNLIWVD